ncbi:MAG: VWA-like domain-containing protein [Sulfurimonas sp.]|nr:VWA-like domain-containing protein [Sulfurimonas sp.]
MQNLHNKISQAKAKLLVDYPYFGTLASRLELVCNDDIQAFRSDGKKVEYSTAFLEEASVSELEFVLANGAMHISLAHEQRKNGRSGWLWQMATDMAINDMLVQNGLDLPYGAQYRVRFAGMYAEEIYAELKSDMIREEDNLEYEADDAADVQENKKEKENKTQQEPQTQLEREQILQEELLQEQLLAEEAISLLEREFKKREAPAAIERFFSIDFIGKINWQDELKSAIDRHFRDDYTLLPPSKKLLSQGIYLPSNVSQTFRLVVVIDSSGSIDDVLLGQFLSEVNFLMSLVARYEIELLVCDEKINSHQTFYSGDTLECDITGGAGTDFRPVFAFVEQNFDDVKLLLYFSDLEGIFPNAAPSYDVKWISAQEKEVPFGELILL